jgi:hypothetical protein
VATQAIVGLGQLTALEVLDPKTKRTVTKRMRGRWLAWDPRKRAFHLCTMASKAGGRLPASVERAHRKFHQAPSAKAVMANVPDSAGGEITVGLVKSLTYLVPPQINSPEKNPHHWHHAFGDTGHKGGDHYPERVMPALVRDRAGNLFIRRRPGNIFRVDTWLRG